MWVVLYYVYTGASPNGGMWEGWDDNLYNKLTCHILDYPMCQYFDEPQLGYQK